MKSKKAVLLFLMFFVFAGTSLIMLNGCMTNPLKQSAATVNDEQIDEKIVTEKISDFRKNNGLENDADWAQYLVDHDYTVESYRDSVLEEAINETITQQEAKKLEANITEEEITSYINTTRESYKNANLDYDGFLKNYGGTEESYHKYLKHNLTEAKMREKIFDGKIEESQLLETANSLIRAMDGNRKFQVIVTTNQDDANEAKNKINSGTEFTEVQKEYSTSQNNQYDGWNSLSYLSTDLMDNTSKMNIGEITEPISVPNVGVFIAKCVDIMNFPQNGFETWSSVPNDFYDQIKETAHGQAAYSSYNDYMTKAKEAAKIVKNDMPNNMKYYVDLTNVQKTPA